MPRVALPYRSIVSVLVATAVLLSPGLTTSASAANGAILIGAGDIASCTRWTDNRVGRLIAGQRGVVFTLGDNAYPTGSIDVFTNCYDPVWGAFKDRTRPSPGNHEYMTEGAAGYFGYFGWRAHGGYYAYWRGAWRVYSLNSEVIDQAQLDWLQTDLNDHPSPCVLAYWHEPLFSSRIDGGVQAVRPFWDILDSAGADLILNGHAHSYERFAPQTPDGQPSEDGITEFVVGTGGARQRSFGEVAANSQVRQTGTWGALKLRLTPTAYDWEFLRAAGAEFTDSGSGTCH